MTPRVRMPALRHWLLGLVVVAATLATFVPALGGDFLGWDDRRALFDFDGWRGAHPVQWAFTTLAMGIYRPLTWLSYAADFSIAGFDPFVFHVTQWLLHAALAAALFTTLLSWCKQPWPAAIATLAYAVHPLRVQAVAWVSARADVLAALFLVLATLAWLHRRRTPWLACFALSLLAKPVAIGAPVAWWLGDRWLRRRPDGRAHVISMSLAAMGGVAALVAKGAFRTGERALPWTASFVAPRNFLWPLWKTLTPVGLGYDEPAFPFDPFTPSYVAGVIAAAAIAAIVYLLRREARGAAMSLLAFVALLAPVAGIVPFGYEITADRFSYVPALVLCFGAARLLARAPRIAIPLSSCVLVVLASMSFAQAQIWADSETFWRHNLALNPRSGMAHAGLGDAALKAGRIDEAHDLYIRALELQPRYEPVLLGLGFIDLVQGHREEGRAKLEAYLLTHPESADAKRFLYLMAR